MIPSSQVQLTRVALPVLENAGLASRVSPHFGKAPGFIVVDSDGGRCRFLESSEARQGHECAPFRALVNDGCRALLCRRMGRGALVRSHEAGLLVFAAGDGGSVADVLAVFRAGDCPDLPDEALCSHGHHASTGEEMDET